LRTFALRSRSADGSAPGRYRKRCSVHNPSRSLEHALTWAELRPSIRAGLWAIGLFAGGVLLAREFAAPIQDALIANGRMGILVFVVTSVLAVLVPVLTNLPLVPLAVLAWGPWWTAVLLLSGWVVGAALAFTLGRRAREWILRHFPAVKRHANIDRLIHPRHRFWSLVLLRMTFPVDDPLSQRAIDARNAVQSLYGVVMTSGKSTENKCERQVRQGAPRSPR